VLLLNDPEASQSTMLPVVEANHGRIETRTARHTVISQLGAAGVPDTTIKAIAG
jgi:hypothetical protein